MPLFCFEACVQLLWLDIFPDIVGALHGRYPALFMVRHGLMLVDQTFSGKTEVGNAPGLVERDLSTIKQVKCVSDGSLGACEKRSKLG